MLLFTHSERPECSAGPALGPHCRCHLSLAALFSEVFLWLTPSPASGPGSHTRTVTSSCVPGMLLPLLLSPPPLRRDYASPARTGTRAAPRTDASQAPSLPRVWPWKNKLSSSQLCFRGEPCPRQGRRAADTQPGTSLHCCAGQEHSSGLGRGLYWVSFTSGPLVIPHPPSPKEGYSSLGIFWLLGQQKTLAWRLLSRRPKKQVQEPSSLAGTGAVVWSGASSPLSPAVRVSQ